MRCYSLDIKSMILKQGDFFFMLEEFGAKHKDSIFVTNFCCLFTYLLLALLIRLFCTAHGVWITFILCLNLYFTSHVLLLLLYHTFSQGPNITFRRNCFEVYASCHHYGHQLISNLPIELTRGDKLCQGLNLLFNCTRVNS